MLRGSGGCVSGPAAKQSAGAALLERFALLGAWAAVILLFSVLLPGSYFTWQNFAVMFASQAPAALLALALIVPLTCGDYDLSGGATVTLAAVILGVMNVSHQQPIGFALLVAIGAGALVGALNAFFIVYVRIPSLVVTLASASIVTGFVQWLSDSSTISGLSQSLIDWVITRQFLGIAYSFYIAALVATLLWYVFEYTPVGRRMLFVGKSREVARLNGIRVDQVRAGALIVSSMLAALAGIVYAGVIGSADPFSGLNFLLPAFAAAFLGATSINPGRFNAWGTFIAVYFLTSGITGLSMFGIPLWVTSVFNGAALILAVTLSQFARGRAESDLG
jgi:ribose transport system permease protein